MGQAISAAGKSEEEIEAFRKYNEKMQMKKAMKKNGGVLPKNFKVVEKGAYKNAVADPKKSKSSKEGKSAKAEKKDKSGSKSARGDKSARRAEKENEKSRVHENDLSNHEEREQRHMHKSRKESFDNNSGANPSDRIAELEYELRMLKQQQQQQQRQKDDVPPPPRDTHRDDMYNSKNGRGRNSVGGYDDAMMKSYRNDGPMHSAREPYMPNNHRSQRGGDRLPPPPPFEENNMYSSHRDRDINAGRAPWGGRGGDLRGGNDNMRDGMMASRRRSSDMGANYGNNNNVPMSMHSGHNNMNNIYGMAPPPPSDVGVYI